MAREIALGRRGPVGADSVEAGGVGNRPMIFTAGIDQREERDGDRTGGRRQENPATFATARGDSGIDENLDMT
jgi:hypothetical protein